MLGKVEGKTTTSSKMDHHVVMDTSLKELRDQVRDQSLSYFYSRYLPACPPPHPLTMARRFGNDLPTPKWKFQEMEL